MTSPVAEELDARLGAIDESMARAESTVAYDLLADAIGRWGDDPRLLRRMALVLARLHATRRANAILQKLYDQGMRDAETAGLLARTFKDLWIAEKHPGRRDGHLRAARRYYDRGFRTASDTDDLDGAIYTGINAAAVALWQRQPRAARAKARQVLDLSRRRLEQGPDYWAAAAAAEATLIAGDVAEAADAYRTASTLAPAQVQWRASTRRNAHLLLRAMGEHEQRLDDCFGIPSVVLLREMPGRNGREPNRQGSGIGGQGSGDTPAAAPEAFVLLNSGAAVQAAEQLVGDGALLTVVLPIPPAALETAAPAVWGRSVLRRRAQDLLARAARVVVAHDRATTLTPTRVQYAERLQTGLARLRAVALATAIVPVAAGTRGLVESSEPAPGRTRLVRRPAEWTDEIKALMFADVAGYSALDEAQVKAFVREFMGRVARVVDRLPARPEVSHTWGDALYFVFPSMAAAGRCALALQKALDPAGWSTRTLPRTLGIRIALHAGPAFRCIDPVQRRLNFTGSHVSWAARIEPITPPGQVYASEPFAALSAAENVTEFRCVYVGTTPLAKKYGVQPLYVVEPG